MKSYKTNCVKLAVLVLLCCFGLSQAQTCRLPVHGYTIAGVYPGMTKEALDELGLDYSVEPNPGHDLYIFSDPRIECAQFSQDMITTVFGYELMQDGKVLLAEGAGREEVKKEVSARLARDREWVLGFYSDKVEINVYFENEKVDLIFLIFNDE